jgi:tight adherence protein C
MSALHLLSSPDLTALAGVAAMILGGAALIASSLPNRSEALALRIRLVSPAGAVRAPAGTRLGRGPLEGLEKLRSLGGSLSEAERRQVVRTFSRVRVGADLAVPYFILLRLVAAAALGTIGFFVAGRLVSFGSLGSAPLLAAAVAAIMGWIAPVFWISRQLKRRTKSVAAALPNALELLVVCVEAGLSLEDGLQRVAHELKESQPALSDELALTWAEVNILPDRTQALANLAVRINNASVRSVVGVLSQGLRYGTPLAQALRAGVVEMRNDQMMALDEQASRLPALMTIPVMLFMMPSLFLLVGGPAVLRVMDTFHH